VKAFSVVLGDEGCYEKFRYPAGEMQVRLNSTTIEALQTENCVVLTARIKSADDIIELCMLTSAIRSQSAITEIKLVLPYLPYGRADRRFVEGDCFGLEVFAGVVNGLGLPVTTLDAHSATSRSLLRNLTDLCPSHFLEKAIKDIRDVVQSSSNGSTDSLTILFPDDGARKRYAGLLTDSNITILHCAKVRDKASGHLSGFSVPSRGEFDSANVLVIDDICDGGGTFLGVAEALKQYGLTLSLYVTHGIFSKGLAPLMAEFRHIYTTDSFGCQLSDPRMTTYSTHEFFQNSLDA
jgi:ribose-phosphate pyrophosphokinase